MICPLKVPVAVGVPVIAPVVALSDSPVGSAPEVTANVTPMIPALAVPQFAVTVKL